MRWNNGLGERVPQTITGLNLNLPACFNGYLIRIKALACITQVSFEEL